MLQSGHRSRFARPTRVVCLTVSLALLTAIPASAGSPYVTPPAGARIVHFDDVTNAPISFGTTIALRTRYAAEGIVFSGPGSDGGAILDDDAGFSIIGYSPPNFLAFNAAGALQGGGLARFPETLLFRQPIRYLQFNVGDTSGQVLTAEAFDADNNSLGSSQVNTSSAMQTLVLEARHIAKVVLTSNGLETIIDDIAFVLDSVVIDFDEVAAPTSFATAKALRDEYDNRSVESFHIMPNDGAAVLDQAAGFEVTGFSPPNFLALNNTSTLIDGGTPKFPLYLQFFPPVKHVEFLVGDKNGSTVDVVAKTWGEEEVDSASIVTGSAMQSVVLDGPSITSVVVTSNGEAAVIDDLEFLVEGTVIDFDDDTNPPSIFNEATALRDRYASFGVHFKAPGNDGAAVLGTNPGMGITGQSGSNVASVDAGDQLANGATPQLPMTIQFDRPLRRVELRVADPAGSRIFFEGRDAADQTTVTSDLFGAAQFEHMPLHFEGTTELIVTGDGPKASFDDLAFLEMEPCDHDPCYQGEQLVRHCSACVTIICAQNSDCCNDGWDQTCAESTDSMCETTCAPLCGDANVDRKVSAPDALLALKNAVGQPTPCPKFRCDFTGDDKVLSGDALQILRTSVGQPTFPNCPPESN